MGICYKVIMLNEFDWGTEDIKKEFVKELSDFVDTFGGEIISVFWNGIVVDVAKHNPVYYEDLNKIILDNCVIAYYNSDIDIKLYELKRSDGYDKFDVYNV